MTVNGECSGCGWILDIRITPGQTTELLNINRSTQIQDGGQEGKSVSRLYA